MRESYVPPVTTAHEPRPAWIAVWRFRVVVVVLIALVALGALEFFRRYVDPNRAQDPGIGEDTNVVETPNAIRPGVVVLVRR